MKKVIVISAINVRNGGALSILQDALSFLQQKYADEYRVVALVHDERLLCDVGNVELIEFPNSTRSYFHRIYYEYVYFKRLSKQLKPYLWLSLHDMSPNVDAVVRAVYCHNPLPFYRLDIKERLIEPKLYMFSKLYQYVYKINLKYNDMVIVQQGWLRDMFVKRFELTPDKVVVAYPNDSLEIEKPKSDLLCSNDRNIFFFPTISRVFKNIEVIIDAVKILERKLCADFEMVITIDGAENKYARYIEKYSEGLNSLKFIGRISRDEVFEWYEKSDCLIFPSKLETWGLPITEFKTFNKPMLVANLPYAYETVGDYDQVNFFDTDNAQQLADMMMAIIDGSKQFMGNKAIEIAQPCTENWSELFSVLLSDDR